jgi:hypothetical protein
MPRGKPREVTIRDVDGREVIGEAVHAHVILPAEDVWELRDYARTSGEGYAAMLERLLREALTPLVQELREARRQSEAERKAKMQRAQTLLQEVRTLAQEGAISQRELRELERSVARK